MFKHTSGIEMLNFFVNVEGNLGSVVYQMMVKLVDLAHTNVRSRTFIEFFVQPSVLPSSLCDVVDRRNEQAQ